MQLGRRFHDQRTKRPIPVDGAWKFFGDVGLAGPDGGKGGKFLLLPPGYKGACQKIISSTVQPQTTSSSSCAVLCEDPKNLKPAVEHLEKTKSYPLNGEAEAKSMKFPDASGVSVNMLPISDGSAFEQLKILVDSEGDNLAGPDWLGMLAAIGIVKGQPFTPDAHTREILDRAAKTGYKTSRVIGFEEEVGGKSLRVFRDRRWTNPFADGTRAMPSGTMIWMGESVPGGYLASTPGSTSSPTTTRSAPAWSRTRRARAPIT